MNRENLIKELENMILTFYPRSVLQEAYPAKEINEIDNGILTKESVKRIEQFFLQKVEEARKEGLDEGLETANKGKIYGSVVKEAEQKLKKEIKMNINELHKYSFDGKWFLKYQEVLKLLK